ncbi:hypothetical protein FK529_07735 [Tsukamurella asaccharolytica]|uniref:Uncharacterized protein n=1 Tax=Tsukamurella asaccharolytica TaxID=2592067 RepID=A0A5C5RC25_9ACTN|nr:hypothetical protein [Tsukamurella asaccharolytica]TWS20024.1 hypothetical protein FK529_07735 [Tsukamurella asaccharolytica]
MGGSAADERWLIDEEYRIARLLDRSLLVLEANLDEGAVRRLQQELGARIERALLSRSTMAAVVERYPASVLVTLVGHASLEYEQGGYWDSFWAALAVERDQSAEAFLRHKIVPLTKKFGLRQFPELAGQYVQVVAMHGGIPRYCLVDLVDVINGHLDAGRDANGPSVIGWLNTPGKTHRMSALDVPVQNFLRYGRELAIDVLNRIVEFVELARIREDWQSLQLDTATTGLPTVLLHSLIDVLTGEFSVTRERRGAIRSRPTVAYSASDAQVQVRLPYPPAGPEVPWTVSLDGAVKEVIADRGWGIDGTDHPATVFPVASAVREVVVQHRPSSIHTSIPLVDALDPMLLFGQDGRHIPAGTTLPQRPLIALLAQSAKLFDREGKELPVGLIGAVAGWPGWRAVDVDPTGVSGFYVRSDAARGPLREFKSAASAAFSLPAQIEGTTTVQEYPVYSQRPAVILPAGEGPAVWHIRTRRAGEVGYLVERAWDTGGAEITVDPFEGLKAGLLGMFEISVTGPLGSNARLLVFLAEGLSVTLSRPIRFPVADGVAPVTAVIEPGEELRVDTREIQFAARDVERAISIHSADLGCRLVVRPPRVEVRYSMAAGHAPWRTSVEHVDPKELAENRVFAVRVPGHAEVRIVVLSSRGVVIKTVDPTVSGFVHSISTREIHDVVKNAGDCSLVAQIVHQSREIRVTIARFRAARLFDRIDLVGESLVLDGVAEGEDLAAFVWAETAPWRPAEKLSIRGAAATLPPALIKGGPLLVTVYLDDPWASVAPPARPKSAVTRVNQPGWITDSDPTRNELARLLAGEPGAFPENLGFQDVWASLAHLMDLHGQSALRVDRELTARLSREPLQALEALGNSGLPRGILAALAIRTGVVRRSFDPGPAGGPVHNNPWVGCMIESARLPLLVNGDDASGRQRAESIRYLQDKGGRELCRTLRGGPTSEIMDATFDQVYVKLDTMPKAQIEEIVEGLGLVPGALLSSTGRSVALQEAFASRYAWGRAASEVEEFAKQVMLGSVRLRRAAPKLAAVSSERMAKLDGLDLEKQPWLTLPSQSLVLALLARLSAHDVETRFTWKGPTVACWSRMAELAPRLVLNDLLIAEALVLNHRHGDLIGVAE